MAKNAELDIPQTGDELTAAWFNRILPDTDQQQVTHVSREVIGEGIGFMGELFRCRLTWSGDASADRPASVIVKLPSPRPENRAVGEGLQAYDREIAIYEKFSGKLGVPMPAFFHGIADPDPGARLFPVILFLFEKLPVRGVNWLINQFLKMAGKSTRRYLLVIEDIDDARPPSQVAGGTVDDAAEALKVLARFHAHNWRSTAVMDNCDMVWPMDRAPKVWQASYLRNRQMFVDQFGDLVGAPLVARMDEVQENFSDYIEPMATEPSTLLHGDYRLDNVLFRPSGDLVILDYQLVSYGRAGWDVGYFITTALTPDHRDEEELLLRTYHDELVGAGVTDYSYDELIADVERTKILLAHRMVGSGDTLDTQMDGEDESFIDLLVMRVMGWVDA